VKTLWTNIGAYGTSLVRFVASGGKTAYTDGKRPADYRARCDCAPRNDRRRSRHSGDALLNPPAAGPVRHDALAANEARLRLPTATVVEHLTRAIHTAIARAPGEDANFEWVRRHFIHHNGTSYFVIPNLYHSGHDKIEELRALAMNQLTGVFADLKLVRALTSSELVRLGKEEERDSYSSLTPFRQHWREEHGEKLATADGEQLRPGLPPRPSRSEITACSPRRSAHSTSPAGARRRRRTSRFSVWSTPKVSRRF